jgi:hypothetical protein
MQYGNMATLKPSVRLDILLMPWDLLEICLIFKDIISGDET